MRWTTRFASILICSEFLLIIILVLTNEDKVKRPAIPLLALLISTMIGCFAAWRWEKIGGIAVIISALGLSVVAFSTSLTFGLGSWSLLPTLVYGIPFLALGILFWICGRKKTAGSTK
jgi:hypothetical protein